ncbi:MAG: glycosyltransferase family 39 protein, partial [Vicinamibacteria bacterium]|nr:glycosyltransferase family 39 protein [Vicinamibacteria bacterium]
MWLRSWRLRAGAFLLILTVTCFAAVLALAELPARLGDSLCEAPSLAWALILPVAFFLIPATQMARRVGMLIAMLGVTFAAGAGLFLLKGRLLGVAHEVRITSTVDDPTLIKPHVIRSLRLARGDLRALTPAPRNFLLSYAGHLYVPADGMYRFVLDCDDRAWLRVDGRDVIPGTNRAAISVPLTAGDHEIEFRYEQSLGESYLRFSWDRPAWFEALPLEAYLSAGGQPQAREGWATAWLIAVAVWGAVLGVALAACAQARASLAAAIQAEWRRKRDDLLVQPLFFVALAVAGLWGIDWIESHSAGLLRRAIWHYTDRNEAGRIRLFSERLDAYPFFFRAVAWASALCALGLTARRRVRWPFSPRVTLALAWAALGSLLTWDVCASVAEWLRFGRPCWDWYCPYSDCIYAVLTRWDAASWQALREHMRANFHANSVVPPLLTALLNLIFGDILLSYRVLSALATVATMACLYLIMRRHFDVSSVAAVVGLMLFAATGTVQRAIFFTQSDPLAMLAATAALLLALDLRAAWSRRKWLLLLLTLAVAMLTKLSAYPLCALAALMLMTAREALPTWPRRLALSVMTA